MITLALKALTSRWLAWLLVVAAIVACGVLIGVQLTRAMLRPKIAALQIEVLKLKEQNAEERARTEAVARAAAESYRELEGVWNAQVRAAEARGAQERLGLQRQRDDLVARVGSLRDAINDTARGRYAAEDTIAACRRDAARLGLVLADVEQAGRRMAEAAERHASDVRTLSAAWPASPSP